MQIYPFRALFPKLDLISSIDSFFGTVKQDYRDYFKSGFFQQQKQEALFVYQIQTKDRAYRGLIGCIDIAEYDKGNIRKHEHTLAFKMQKQVALALQRKAAVKPVLLTYPGQEQIKDWTDQYLERTTAPSLKISFQEDQTTHSFWPVMDPGSIRELQALFNDLIPIAYIADGHHRSAAQAFMHKRGVEKSVHTQIDRLLCAFFPPDQLEIFDFNRIVSLGADFSPALFMAKLSQICTIEIIPEIARPAQKHEILLGMGEEWYTLRWKEEILEGHQQKVKPDAQLLNELILDDILGIHDIRTNQRISYVEGPKGLNGLMRKARSLGNCLVFILHPVQAEEFFQLIDLGIMLPPKSTWFEPRMKNGLLVHSFS